MIAEYLTYKGCRVKLAHDGVQALTLARQETPVVILMDLQMPGMDGLEAIRHLRLMPQCAHLPIIALTALAMSTDRERALAAGASEYMTKPVRLEQLAAAVERCL